MRQILSVHVALDGWRSIVHLSVAFPRVHPTLGRSLSRNYRHERRAKCGPPELLGTSGEHDHLTGIPCSRFGASSRGRTFASRRRCGQLARRPYRVVSATRHAGVVDVEAPNRRALGLRSEHRDPRSGPGAAPPRRRLRPCPKAPRLGFLLWRRNWPGAPQAGAPSS
jgi:hypothetical protein